MPKMPKLLTKTLSLRLSVIIVGATALLLLASLGVMFYFSRKALKQEALQNAEQTLEGTVQHIDNILLSVEQATGNIYFSLLYHLKEVNTEPGLYLFFVVSAVAYEKGNS